MKFVLYVDLVNSPEAVAKLMLTVKQGNLSIESASMHRSGNGNILTAILLLEGEERKGEWLANKLLNYPYFERTQLMKAGP